MLIHKYGFIALSKARFHERRLSYAAIRLAIYVCVCGLFFIVGSQFGLHGILKQASNRMDSDNLERKASVAIVDHQNTILDITSTTKYDSGDPESDKDGQGHHQGRDPKSPGVIRIPIITKLKPGEMGKPFTPTNLTDAQKQLMKDGWENNAFNQYVSDLISVERSLPDVRHPRCKLPDRFLPVSQLPSTSVIIVFHNEAWSSLLRTFHSVLIRSPPKLLKEIILVDDNSTQGHLQSNLDDYIKHYPKVKIIRSDGRIGLIRARILGALAAKGETLTFLDSHVEVSPGWLEPLLDRVARNKTTVVCPIIDVISDETLEYEVDTGSPDDTIHNIGVFDWSLTFYWTSMSEKDRQTYNDTSQPVASPTMAGGLFSINKAFFKHLGYYDPEFDIWGGENLELSFKTWMCGGRLEIVPCSHVGHIFRKRSPYEWRAGVNAAQRNLVRLSKVWLDEYAQYYYDRIGNDLEEFGNITDRVELRKRLNCQSFDWYMKNVVPDLYIPDVGYSHGEFRNLGLEGQYCLDAVIDGMGANATVGMYECHGQGNNQFFTLTKNFEIRRDNDCLDYSGDKVVPASCHGGKGNQEWHYHSNTKQLMHVPTKKCLAMESITAVKMDDCQDDENMQKWTLQNYSETLDSSNEKTVTDNANILEKYEGDTANEIET